MKKPKLVQIDFTLSYRGMEDEPLLASFTVTEKGDVRDSIEAILASLYHAEFRATVNGRTLRRGILGELLSEL